MPVGGEGDIGSTRSMTTTLIDWASALLKEAEGVSREFRCVRTQFNGTGELIEELDSDQVALVGLVQHLYWELTRTLADGVVQEANPSADLAAIKRDVDARCDFYGRRLTQIQTIFDILVAHKWGDDLDNTMVQMHEGSMWLVRMPRKESLQGRSRSMAQQFGLPEELVASIVSKLEQTNGGPPSLTAFDIRACEPPELRERLSAFLSHLGAIDMSGKPFGPAFGEVRGRA